MTIPTSNYHILLPTWESINKYGTPSNQIRCDQLLSCVRLCATPWIPACQASLSIRSSLKLMSIESVMPSRHLILCGPLLLLTPIPRSIRVFSKESILRMRWPKYWSFSFSIIPSKEIPGLISFRRRSGWISLQSKGLSRVSSNTTVQKHLACYLLKVLGMLCSYRSTCLFEEQISCQVTLILDLVPISALDYTTPQGREGPSCLPSHRS